MSCWGPHSSCYLYQNVLPCFLPFFHIHHLPFNTFPFIFLFSFFISKKKKFKKKMSTIFFLPIFLCFIFLHSTNANYWPISPGYYPSTKFKSMSFYQGFKNLWGPNHQSVDNNGINIWLDRNSGLIFFNYS